MNNKELEELEIDLLLTAIERRYGYNFHNYARSSLKRRIKHCMNGGNLATITDMLSRIVHDEVFFDSFLTDMSITVTEMFRDASFYLALREHVIPLLKTYPFIKIWHAGCATGEEVYSMAILLKEAGIYERCQIYATDYNKRSLAIAEEGIYKASLVKDFTHNYHEAGGEESFSDYYSAHYESAKMDKKLKENMTFAHHNMVSDGVFGEMNMVVCRNVMIYFNKTLQSQVLNLFLDSLCHGGLLCLGSKETVEYSDVADQFGIVSKTEKIYKKAMGKKQYD